MRFLIWVMLVGVVVGEELEVMGYWVDDEVLFGKKGEIVVGEKPSFESRFFEGGEKGLLGGGEGGF